MKTFIRQNIQQTVWVLFQLRSVIERFDRPKHKPADLDKGENQSSQEALVRKNKRAVRSFMRDYEDDSKANINWTSEEEEDEDSF